MSQRNMLQFSTLLLLPLSGVLVLGELSENFHNCLQFFYNNIPPQGITGAQYCAICQRYDNTYHFATLYDRHHRAPLYSAYILGRAPASRPDVWMYEPQLIDQGGKQDMQAFQNANDQNVKPSQAVPKDYMDSSIYTQGHLAPSGHQATESGQKATFTLTNIVPQRLYSNSGTWEKLENEVLDKLKNCQGTMYVITGTIPFTDGKWIEDLDENKRVAIPEYIWSAYCCSSPAGAVKEFPTYAAVGRNNPNSEDTIVPKDTNLKQEEWQGFAVKTMPLQELENILKKQIPNISLFDKGCQDG